MYQPPNQSGNWQEQPPYPPQSGYLQQPPSTYQQQPQYQQGPFTPPPMPPAPQKKKSRTWLWIVGMILVAIVSYSAGATSTTTTATTATPAVATTSDTNTTSAAAQPTQAPAATPKPTAAPKWVTVQTFKGSGSKKTQTFTIGDTWAIGWACDPASSAIGSYNVIVAVDNSDGTPADPGAINTICKTGNTSDQTQEHQGGNVYLDIQSEGDWVIVVQELK